MRALCGRLCLPGFLQGGLGSSWGQRFCAGNGTERLRKQLKPCCSVRRRSSLGASLSGSLHLSGVLSRAGGFMGLGERQVPRASRFDFFFSHKNLALNLSKIQNLESITIAGKVPAFAVSRWSCAVSMVWLHPGRFFVSNCSQLTKTFQRYFAFQAFT